MYKTGCQFKRTIEKYKEALRKQGINVKQVIVYGSFSKGKQRIDSDIDLIIVSSDFEKMNLRKRLEILGIAAARVMKPIEARGYTPSELKKASRASFLNEVLTTGVTA